MSLSVHFLFILLLFWCTRVVIRVYNILLVQIISTPKGSKMTKEKEVGSILYTKASEKLEEEIQKELEKEDPTLEEAKAKIHGTS